MTPPFLSCMSKKKYAEFKSISQKFAGVIMDIFCLYQALSANHSEQFFSEKFLKKCRHKKPAGDVGGQPPAETKD